MTYRFQVLILLLVVLVLFVDDGVWAFGAGNIPSFAYLEGKAFRHGDIEDILSELLKKAGSGFLSRGSKFGGLDIKRVYFGNWLRDYSQAVDIAGLKKLPLQTIINLCMALGFLANGYATGEFEVTAERLGCYLPTEHIDNPKGYGDGEDARKYHPSLRPPVNPRELEIDHRTGMKNYIANETGTWDTSKALVRRTLERCINLGRQARRSGRKEDEHEAFRLLGQSLHTLEDFPAHSNFCELSLVSLGHQSIFCHVGDQVRVQAPNGKSVAPLVTGTFGSSDFIHSLLGEATDHISEASVSDLTKEMDKARSAQSRGIGDSNVLRELFTQIPGLGSSDLSRQMDNVERISRAGQPGGGGKKPEEMSPEELHATLWQILTFRDSIMMKIEATIEKIPGLSSLVEKLTNSIAVFVYTTIEPFLKPLLQTATTQLASTSAEVINTHDQFEVFNDPRASDPTHSFLSKDHFGLILNEPAGKLAQVIVRHVVTLVVKAWDDSNTNPHEAIEAALECMFHPDFHNPNSPIQREMMQFMRDWLNSHGNKQHEIIQKLSKESVRNHGATRIGSQQGHVGGVGHDYGVQAQGKIQGYLNQVPGVVQAQSIFGAPSGPRRDVDPPMIGSPGPYGHNPAGPPSYPGGPPAPNHSSYGAPPGAPPIPSHSTYPGANAPPVSHASYPGGPPSGSGGYYQPPSFPPPGPGYGQPTPAFPGGPSSYSNSGPPPGPTYGGPPIHAPHLPTFPSPGGHHESKKEKKKKDKHYGNGSGSSDSDSSDDGYGRKKDKKEKKHKKHGSRDVPSFPSTGGPPGGGYAPPSGPPPSFPGAPGGFPPPSGYPPHNPPPPSLPGAPQGFGFPGAPPSGGGGYGPPGGPPPSFPGGPPNHQPPYPPYNQGRPPYGGYGSGY